MNAATASALSRDPFMPQAPKVRGRAITLAVLAHVLLILAIAFGVNWRNSEPATVAAELWSATPQAAAPRAVEAPPTPQPEAKPPPEPVAKPVVKAAEPVTPPKPPPTLPDPQIAIEKAKREETKRVAAEQEQRREKAERLEAEREKRAKDESAQKRAAADKAEKLKADRDQAAKAERAEKAEKAERAERAERAEPAMPGWNGRQESRRCRAGSTLRRGRRGFGHPCGAPNWRSPIRPRTSRPSAKNRVTMDK